MCVYVYTYRNIRLLYVSGDSIAPVITFASILWGNKSVKDTVFSAFLKLIYHVKQVTF